jgi:hypothetical protein
MELFIRNSGSLMQSYDRGEVYSESNNGLIWGTQNQKPFDSFHHCKKRLKNREPMDDELLQWHHEPLPARDDEWLHRHT